MERFLYKRPEHKTPKINVLFSYPAIESFAMASLGYLSIFQMFDCDSEIYVERVYEDSIKTKIPPKNAHCMGFSISFELDILTVIKMLKKYDINVKAFDREESDPLIFAGGPVLMANPKPFEEIFDFISIGEKTVLKDAMNVIKNSSGLKKDEILKKLSDVEGIYVPKFKKEKVKIVRDVIKNEVVYTPILSDKSFFKDTFIVELERGCPKMCNFCLASWLNLPVRFVDYQKIIEAIDFGLNYTDKIALLGAAVALHPDFKKIIEHISKKCETRDIELSISSLRADAVDIDLIKTLVKCGQKTATIALEAASQRLRDFINKNLNENQVLNMVRLAQEGGLTGLKIYAMLGLPTETDEDIEEFITLSNKIKKVIKEGKNKFDITISASTFIPKAHTPFEKAKRCDKKTLEKRINYLKKELHKIGINFRISSVDWDIVQSILSRYNDNLVDFLIDVEKNGATLGAFKQTWRKYAKKGYLMPYEESSRYPLDNIKAPDWNFIDTGANTLKDKRISALEPYLI